MASSSSSSLTLLAPPFSLHHVFPSFHGADVRTNFLSHLVKEFRSKGIDVFIDNDIERSKSIGPKLIEAIRGSRVAIVLLSQNYASSTWCLNELVEIIKCREEFGQTVISLFYQVDPTDVKKQTGDFGKVFEDTCRGKTEEEIRRWKHALTEVAQIAGYHSSNWETEAEMIAAIATDVSTKLNLSAPSSDFEGLVGMESQMTKMKRLLQLDSDEAVRKIGIWGPPGIGKTTIARSLFNRYARDFQMSVFMGNIKRKYATMACSDDYSVKLKLQKKMMSQLTNDKDIKVRHLGVAKDRLKDKKVLVVLDDVDRSVQVEAMANETWLGPGSLIVIATQDQKVLKESRVDYIHKVDLPSYDEALQMFCMYAFGQKDPKDGFGMLACEAIHLVGRLPLGLRVMGSYFRGMSEQDWTEALPKLKAHLDRDGQIMSILKFSYDALCDEDKRLFLHIACFFNHENVDIVEGCLAKCFLDVRHGLRVLVEKSLIDIDYGKSIRMAELLVQLGRKIVREEYVSEPGKRRFLHDAEDIEELLGDDKAGSNNVIGINLEPNEEITWTSERAFERLSNLQFLRINGKGVNPQSMNYISRKLRVLKWWWSPMTYFPSSFTPEFLVRLDMSHSRLVKLWEGIKPLRNLKWMDLNFSKSLKELPDLSTAVNLQELHLRGCKSLVKLPSSIGNAINLIKLDLRECSSLVEIPSSIGNAINLSCLDIIGCSSLVEIPSSITTITNLKIIDLDGCSSLVELPFNIEIVLDLPWEISLSGCSSLVELPSSIGNATNLQKMNLRKCSSLTKLPSSMRNLRNLSKLELEGCSKLEVNLANINLESLYELDLSHCSSLKSYQESSTNIEELDQWFGRISRLRRLVLRGMKKLTSLPPLPDSILFLDASNCESLERIDCSIGNPDILLDFANCVKLNKEARDLIIHTTTNKYAVFPAEEVPMCFTYRSSGSSVTVKLEQKPPGKSTKFKACIILGGEGEWERDGASVSVCCSITSGGNALTACYKGIEPIYLGHLYTFEVEVETEDVTSTELAFEFDLCYREVKECGVLPLLEVPLLNFTDVVGDYEPSDTALVPEDEGRDKRLLLLF